MSSPRPIRVRPSWAAVVALLLFATYAPRAAAVILALLVGWRALFAALARMRRPPAPLDFTP